MTRTLQERLGLPGRARHDPLDNRARHRGVRQAGQLPPAMQARVRVSQIEVDRVQP